MSETNLDALVLCDPDSIFYFTGCKIAPGERMFLLVVTADTLALVLPEMFTDEAKTARPEVERVFFKDTDRYVSMACSLIGDAKRIGVDKLLVAKFLLPMMEELSHAHFVDGSAGVDFLRMHKNPEECEKMRISSLLNDKIIGAFADYLALPSAIGISERDGVKRLLEIAEENGVEGVSFDPIVSFGAGTAQPHHEPAGDVYLQPNSPIILDIGFVKNGYCSDMTRSFFRTEDRMLQGCTEDETNGEMSGETSEETPSQTPAQSTGGAEEKVDLRKKFLEIYDIVKRANLAGIAKVAPGVPLSEVDAAARSLIEAEGYGEFFTHRLGHGIGIAVHEFPDVSAASEAICAEGMIFSIEPGIYHPESGIGIRIEDLVLVTKDGCEVLNKYPK